VFKLFVNFFYIVSPYITKQICAKYPEYLGLNPELFAPGTAMKNKSFFIDVRLMKKEKNYASRERENPSRRL
jgi:hypothetical protein